MSDDYSGVQSITAGSLDATQSSVYNKLKMLVICTWFDVDEVTKEANPRCAFLADPRSTYASQELWDAIRADARPSAVLGNRYLKKPKKAEEAWRLKIDASARKVFSHKNFPLSHLSMPTEIDMQLAKNSAARSLTSEGLTTMTGYEVLDEEDGEGKAAADTASSGKGERAI